MRRLLLVVALGLACCPHRLWATGNDNPTGVTGDFNGQITTGGSYDPYTGNAKRIVTDLEVAGSVGAYPLRWTRTLNTRGGRYWNHSYTWYGSVRIGPKRGDDVGSPYEGPDAKIGYPQGESVDFYGSSPGYRSNPGGEPGDRLVLRDNGNYELLMRDGGVVVLVVSATHVSELVTTHDLRAVKIIDPFKQETTLSYDVSGRLSRITEPGGRYLQANYDPAGLIGSVQAFASAGALIETVTYTYQSLNFNGNTATGYLTQVNYADGSLATYTYQQANVWPYTSGLIKTCNDVRFAGPMSKIEYEFMPLGSIPSPDVGQLKAERNATTHQVVSQVTYPSRNDPAYVYDPAPSARTETRGDGETRSFQYGIGTLDQQRGVLSSYTDFKNQRSSIERPYDPYTPYRKSFTDARGKTTHNYLNGNTGAVLRTTHPDGSYLEYEYSDMVNPRFLTSRSDERRNFTYYDRDAKNRIWQTRYPDGGVELFTYNGFGQVVTHTMTSGGVENFRYDARGLKTLSWPPATATDPNPEAHPTRYFYYQSGPQTDRLRYQVDPRGNATWYEYNLRGQVTKLTHQDGTFIQSFYNPDGTLKWTADENHPGAATNPSARTRYTYDEYKRVLTVTNPENETTTNNYAPWSGIGSLSHTTGSTYTTSSPMGKEVAYDYDANFRRTALRKGWGSADDDGGTYFGYDEAGNLISTTDQQNNITGFGYDDRNRQTSIKDALGRITQTEYGPTGNKLWVKRALGFPLETIVQFIEYDPMNRLKEQVDERGVHTKMGYDSAGNLTSTTDGNGNVYQTAYDYLNRRKSMTYPGATTETWTHDAAGNLTTHKVRSGAVQTYAPYDNRNRATSFSWSDGTQGQSFEYDDASRLTRVFNAEANITFGYDDANRKKSETVTTKSYGLNVTRAVLYDYDLDGNRSRLVYPQGNQYLYAYTERNQLDTIKLDPALFGAQPALVNYAYDNRGNRTSRVGAGGAHTEYEIDELNRIEGQTNYFSGGKTIRFDYGFDALGRRRYEQRDHAAADGYQYDPADEVTFYRRGGSLNGDGSVSGGSTVVDFDPYDGNGNKTGVRTNGKLDTHVHNNLNQYESTTALGALGYDLKGNLTKLQGWAYTYDAQNRLIALDHVALNVHIRQHYDPLNRMIARNNNGVITSYVWDNWNLLEERKGTGAIKRCYVYGANQNEVVQAYEGGVYAKLWYWQDGRGNTAAVSGEAGFLAERYRYDLTGTPSFYDANNFAQASANDTRFLFAGSLYQPESGLYDMRNRFYHPTLSRFLQTDPIGFKGDALNLYRYCENDFVDRSDPEGLDYEDLFNTRDAVARDFNRIYNPQSIRLNREMGSTIYKTGDRYSYTKPVVGTSHDARNRNPIPQRKGIERVGDIHAHGDYSTAHNDRSGRLRDVTRVDRSQSNWRTKDSFDSDNPSKPDKLFWHEQGAGRKEYTGYLTTPGNRLWKQDGVDQQSKPMEINSAQTDSKAPDATQQEPPKPQKTPGDSSTGLELGETLASGGQPK